MYVIKHAQFFSLACMGPYTRQMGSDRRDQGIYGMRRACQSCLSSEDDTSTPASMHACYIFAYTCPNLSQIRSDQRDHGIYLGDHAGQFGAPK